jgi:hypothetical protein
MRDGEREQRATGSQPRVRAVIDTCVLVVNHHMRAILGAAADGHLIPIWCPCIIAEANCVLTWR